MLPLTFFHQYTTLRIITTVKPSKPTRHSHFKVPRVAQRDAHLTEAALQTRPVLSLSFLMRSEIPLEDCYLFDETGSWSGKPKKATSDGP